MDSKQEERRGGEVTSGEGRTEAEARGGGEEAPSPATEIAAEADWEDDPEGVTTEELEESDIGAEEDLVEEDLAEVMGELKDADGDEKDADDVLFAACVAACTDPDVFTAATFEQVVRGLGWGDIWEEAQEVAEEMNALEGEELDDDQGDDDDE